MHHLPKNIPPPKRESKADTNKKNQHGHALPLFTLNVKEDKMRSCSYRTKKSILRHQEQQTEFLHSIWHCRKKIHSC